ncbi:MAG: hypothetical protein JXM70_27935, partial [Pirellulales bacterium]|nr:hypothetical protein [Pirellulales bacterium]
LGDYILLGVAVTGTQCPEYIGGGTVNFGYDVGTPTAIASDPLNKPLLPGDLNLDGRVDVADLGILAMNYNPNNPPPIIIRPPWTMGDVTRDGIVDVSDLGTLAAYYGTTVLTAVPEPAMLCMLGLCSMAMLLVRHRGKRWV